LLSDRNGTAEKEKPIAQRVREYLSERPVIRDHLRQGLLNYSALARRMIAEEGFRNEEAIVVALRRAEAEIADTVRGQEASVLALLAESRLEMRTKIGIVTAKNDWVVMARLEQVIKRMLSKRSFLQVIQGTDSITVICDEAAIPSVLETVGSDQVLRTRPELAEVLVRAPEKIAETPGVVAYLTDLLAWKGINIIEMVSCHTDVVFIVDREEMVRAYETLSRIVHRASTNDKSPN